MHIQAGSGTARTNCHSIANCPVFCICRIYHPCGSPDDSPCMGGTTACMIIWGVMAHTGEMGEAKKPSYPPTGAAERINLLTDGCCMNARKIKDKINWGICGVEACVLVTKSTYLKLSFALIRRELHPFGVHVSIIAPGGFNTPMAKKVGEDISQVWNRAPPDIQKSYGHQYFENCKLAQVSVPKH